MTKFYIASLFSEREQSAEIANQIEERLGWVNVARWVKGGEEGLLRHQIADLDLEDVNAADVFIVISHPRGTPKPGGGRWVEFGYALARGKWTFVIGPYENVFTHHEDVKVYPTVDCFLSDLEVQK